MNTLVTLNIYEYYFDACNDKQLLESNNINVYIANEFTIQNDWLLKQAIGGIRLQVFEDDLEMARSIIFNKNNPENQLNVEYWLDPGYLIYPNCGSNHTYRDEKLNGFFGLSILLIGFPVKTKNNTFHCYFCNNEWKE